MLGIVYAIRVTASGPLQFARVEQEGGSTVQRAAMQMLYWTIDVSSRLLVKVGIAANTISWCSVLFAFGAGVTAALGSMGLSALLMTLSSACDALDGAVARVQGTASDAGEVLDAALDRYSELFFLGGITIYFRFQLPLLLVSLAALSASFMVSYTTAKAEALHVEVSRGTMRRTERLFLLIAGAASVPVISPHSVLLASTTLIFSLGLVALFGHISSAMRLIAVAQRLRERDAS